MRSKASAYNEEVGAKDRFHFVTLLLVLDSLGATYLMLQVMPRLDATIFTTAKPIREQYGTQRLDPGEVAPAGSRI